MSKSVFQLSDSGERTDLTILMMEIRDLHDQLLRLSLKSLMRSLKALSQECDNLKKQGMVSRQQLQAVIALHDHLMQMVGHTLINFMTENPAFSAEIQERFQTSALENLLYGTGVSLCETHQ